MAEWLGIEHLVELSRTEAIAGLFTPLVIFAVFFLAQLILPGRRVTGYVINPETGEPRDYRLNGLLVFAIAIIVGALELTGMPRDWFYRSSIYAVAGGTVFVTILPPWPCSASHAARTRTWSWLSGRGGLRSYRSSRTDSTSRCTST